MVSDLCEYQSTRLKNLEKHSQKSVKKCLDRQIKHIMEQVDQSDQNSPISQILSERAVQLNSFGATFALLQ